MKLLTNPVFARMALVLFIALAGFLVGVLSLKLLRRRIVEDDAMPDDFEQDSIFPYTAVIQQLKQQKFALQNEQQIQQRRAKTAEQITATVIANLPCGFVFFAPNGLVRQANAAARQILGFASPLGMSIEDLFRGARAILDSDSSKSVAELIHNALQNQERTGFEASFQTASGIDRTLAMTLIPVTASSGDPLGVAVIVLDQSAVQDARREHVMNSEIAAELALELRTSLSTIRECAATMGSKADATSIAQLARDIAAQTEHLEKVVGGFLAGGGRMRASAAGA